MFSFIRRLLGAGSGLIDRTQPVSIAASLDEVRQRAMPALLIERAAQPGRSKLGGYPDLPADHSWPTWNGTPLAFLAQIDCSAVAAAGAPDWLPSTGMLFFFYHPDQMTWGFDPADRGSWRVLFDANGPADKPATAPTGLVIFGEIPIGFRAAMSIPDSQRLEAEGGRVSDAVFDAIEAERTALFGDAARHQLGGYPQPVQNDDMELECELVSNGINCGSPEGYRSAAAVALSAGGATAWRLLLQLDSDDDADMMWGDSGMLYFWVREADARARDFTETWMILQCC